MYGADQNKSNAQKLAETLKRCGLASSVSQAHQMAGDITSTERKVQTFFDQKKQEMKDDLMRNVHPNREEFKSNNAKDIVSAQIQSFREKNSKGQIDNLTTITVVSPLTSSDEKKSELDITLCTKSHSTIETVKIEPEKELLITESAQTVSANTEVIKEESHPNMLSSKLEVYHEEVSTNELSSNEDYVNNFIPHIETDSKVNSEKETVIEEKWPELKIAEEKEEVKVIEEPKIQPEIVSEPVHHPKPVQPTVDINNFFNFQKKGKV